MKAKFYSSISRRSYYTYNDAPERLLHNPLDIQQLLSVSKFRQTVGPNNGIQFRFRLFCTSGYIVIAKTKTTMVSVVCWIPR